MIPTLGTIDLGADLTVEVPVEDLGSNYAVRVDYAVAATVPDATSRLWREVDTLESVGSAYTPVQVKGTTVWVRAAGVTSAGVRSSGYTTPVDIAVADGPRFDTFGFTLAGRVPTATWEPSALTLGVRAYWDVHAAGTDPGTLSSYEDVEAVYGTFTPSVTLADGEAITFRLEAWSAWSSDAVDGTEGENVGGQLVQKAPAVEAHAYTHIAGGTDELDLTGCVLTAPDGSRWRLTVSNSGELGAEEISSA
jgi:hypothetical protein